MPFVNQVKCLDGNLGEIACGLVVKTDTEAVGIPLVAVSAKIDIINVAAEVTLEQTFVNNSPDIVQCVYFFPTEDGVAVHAFKATLDQRTLVGVVKDKETARDEFVEAVEQNKTAFLLEEIKPDIMELYIGNLNAGSTCVIQIKYVLELGVQEFKPRFTLPTTIAPRYIPPSEPNMDMEKANYQFTTIPDVPLTIHVNTLMRTPIKEISSPTHKIVAKIQDTKEDDGFYHGSTELKTETTSMDKDFVLIIDCEDPLKEVVIVEKTEGEDEVAITISFVPQFDAAEINCEFIFLVDCSGSMSGEPMNKAKDALQIFLQSLPEDCYFNIYRFGSSFESLFPRSVRYDANNLKKAKGYNKVMQANLGGTEILQPILTILPGTNIEGYRKQVFIVTDGQVSNTSSVISHITENKGDGRVFSLGIGDSASRELVKGIAKSGSGTALFCTLLEPMHEKVIQLLSNAVASSTKLVNIECTMSNDTTLILNKEHKAPDNIYQDMHSPNLPMTMFSQNKVTFYMLLNEIPSAIRYICKTELGQTVEFVSQSQFCVTNTVKIHKLVAHEIVRCKGAQRNSGQYYNENNVEATNLCLELAVKYGIVSPFTSFVCIDETQANISYSQNLNKDLAFEDYSAGFGGRLCAGFGGAGGSMGQMYLKSSSSCSDSKSFSYGAKKSAGLSLPNPFAFVGSAVRSLKAKKSKRSEPLCMAKHIYISGKAACGSRSWSNNSSDEDNDCSGPGGSTTRLPVQQPYNNDAKLVKILDLSDIKGVFPDLTSLCKVIEKDPEKVEAVQKQTGIKIDVFTTILALQYLEMFYRDSKTSWMMIEKKSLKWLHQQLQDDVKFQEIKETINSLLKNEN